MNGSVRLSVRPSVRLSHLFSSADYVSSGADQIGCRTASVCLMSVNNCFESQLLLQFSNNPNQIWHKVRTLGGAKTVEAEILNFWLSQILGGSKGKNLTCSLKIYLLLQFLSDYDEILHRCGESKYKKGLEPGILIFGSSQILWGAKLHNFAVFLDQASGM